MRRWWALGEPATSAGDRRKRIVVSIYDDPGNPYYAGGGPLVVRRIVESLAESYDVVVVTGGYPGARRTSRHRVTYVPLPLGWAGPRLGQLLYTTCLLVLVRVARFDLWIESFTPPFSSSFLPLVARRPVLGLAQALSGREMARRYGSSLFLVLERWALRAYSDVVVMNEHDRMQVRACSPRSRVHLIPNVIELAGVEPTGSGDGRYVLFLGRIDFEQKGLHLLFEAHRRLGEQAPPLVIAGSGRAAEMRRLHAAVRAAGPQVRWVGPVAGEQKAALLAGSALVVVPSVEESFCLVALEALACGRPVVHFDLPQLGWIPQDCGVTVPPFDVSGLAAAMLLLSGDRERRAEAGRRGFEFAEAFVRGQPPDPYARLAHDLLSAGESSRAGSYPAAAGGPP